MVPALILIVGSLIVPLLKGISRKVYIMLLPALAFITILLMKPGTVIKTNFLTGFKLTLVKADWISLTVGLGFIILGFFALLYTIQVKKTAHHVLALWYIGGTLGVVFAGDFLSLYLFWELIAVVATVFILLDRDKEAVGAAFRYIIMHIIGGLLLLAGIWLHYFQTGSLEITHLAKGLPFYLIVAGAGVNAGLYCFIPG